jgi:UDP-glucose:glycoprotein glucosyltransferase
MRYQNFLNSLQFSVAQALQHFQENVRFHLFPGLPYLPRWGFIQVYSGVITDADAENIENYFYDLPTTMKRRNRHVVPVGNGGVRVASLPTLHQQAGLNASPAMFIYPGKTISNSSQISRRWQCRF